MTPLIRLGCALFVLAMTPFSVMSATPQAALHLAASAAFTSLDPHGTSDIYSGMATALSYEALYGYEFDSSPLKLEPALAAALPQVSPDGLIYTVTLKPGIHFQNDPCFAAGIGRELVAQDVVRSFERIADVRTRSPSYGQFANLIKGLVEFHVGKAPEISGFKILGSHRLRIELLRPFPRFVHLLAGIHSAIVPVECVRHYGDAWPRHAVGTGAFRIETFSQDRVIARRNETYRKQVYRGEILPLVETVEIESIVQEMTRWLRFKSGSLDAITVPRDGLSEIPELEKSKSVKHFSRTRSDVTYMILNLRDVVYGKNIKLRKALCSAIDYMELIRVAYGGSQAAVQAKTLIPPGMNGFTADAPAMCEFKSEPQDVMKDASTAPEIIYLTQNDTLSRQIAESLSRQLKRAGFRLNPQFLTWPEMATRLNQGSFTMAFYGWTSDFPDVDNHLWLLASAAVPPAGNNFGFFRNKKYDELVNQIAGMKDGGLRQKKIGEALAIIAREVPLLPVAHRIGHRLFQPWVKNAAFSEETLTGSWVKYWGVGKKSNQGSQ